MSDFQSNFAKIKAAFAEIDPTVLTVVIVIMAVIILISIIVYALFCLSIYKGLKLVPDDKLLFPRFLVWLMLIPGIGVIFFWLVLPFNVPTSFSRTVPENGRAQKDAVTLKGLGLAYAIMPLLAYSVFFGMPAFVGSLANLAILPIWIIYWVKVVAFRKSYLENR